MKSWGKIISTFYLLTKWSRDMQISICVLSKIFSNLQYPVSNHGTGHTYILLERDSRRFGTKSIQVKGNKDNNGKVK